MLFISLGTSPKRLVFESGMFETRWGLASPSVSCATVQIPQERHARACLSCPEHIREWGSTLPTESVSFCCRSCSESKLFLFLCDDEMGTPTSSLSVRANALCFENVERAINMREDIAESRAYVRKSHQTRACWSIEHRWSLECDKRAHLLENTKWTRALLLGRVLFV